MQYFNLRNNDKMPALGLGTWKSKDNEVYDAIRTAIKTGYRHIDCAAIYGNEAEIGKALSDAFADGDVKREELWITSKLWCTAHREQQVVPALQQTLKDLQLEYLDLYLVHWPIAYKESVRFPKEPSDFISLEEIPIVETWRGMEDCEKKGLTRHIGVSNFSSKKLAQLVANATHRPEVNQVELHPYLQQRDLIDYCNKEDIILTAYSPLGSFDKEAAKKEGYRGGILDNPEVEQLAKENNCTPAQLLISWAITRGTTVIPKSTNAKRIKENFEAGELFLDGPTMDRLEAMDKHHRFVDGTFWEMEGGPYTVANIWDE